VKYSNNDTLLLRILAATSLACVAPVYAQNATTAPATDAAASDLQGLEEVVVTASGGDKSQLNSSVSVTSVSSDLIENFHPTSDGEILRLIPGLQVSGTGGAGGNSNIGVRGLPVATGGSPFVQIQEDGLPTVLFGDIQFGNNDYWTHFDSTVANIEAVRGGSASTYASQAPGAVINYISRTGKEDGGKVSLSRGLGYDETKLDFRNGGHISDSIYYHVGGYFQNGRGPLDGGYILSNSTQVKGNITKELSDGKGYFRFLFKYAKTQEPNYNGAPAFANVTATSVSGFRPYTNYDGRSDTNYSTLNQNFLIVNREGALERVKLDGITTKAQSFGNQFHYVFNDSITLDNNARWTEMSGGFASPFLSPSPTASVLGSDPLTANVAKYANGPNAGQVYTGAYINTNTNVRTNIRDIGSFANDLAVAGKFNLGAGSLTARAGLFYMNQRIAMDWHTNKTTTEVSGNNPAMLDIYDAAGNKLTANGLSGFNNNWGDCCARDYDLSYADNAPYLGLDFNAQRFDIDGSIRFENIKASGWAIKGGSSFDTNVSGVLIPTFIANGPGEVYDYTRKYQTYSLGALFKLNDNTSLFARASRGGRFNADRQTLGGKVRADGGLCTSGDVELKDINGVVTRPAKYGCGSDGVTPSVDFVNQYEIGVKNRGNVFGGRYTVELTLLNGDFKQSNYEPTITAQCATGGCVIDSKFKSQGAELFATYRLGGLSLVGNATYSNSKSTARFPTFSRHPGLPDLTYTLSSNYDFGARLTAGLNVTGNSDMIDYSGRKYPGSDTFGASLNFTPVENLEVGLQVYNLFDKFVVRGIGDVVNQAAGVVKVDPARGRLITGTVSFKF
jgi:outer membrane receptor protein involved in Fe transport